MFPLFLDLSGKRVLVVGGGPVGRRKAGALLDAGAHVRLVCLEPRPVEEAHPHLAWLTEPFVATHLKGVVLAFAAGPSAINLSVVAEAKAHGIWVNSATDGAGSDFVVPAVHRRGDFVLAVSTGGAARNWPSKSATAWPSNSTNSTASGSLCCRRFRPLVLERIGQRIAAAGRFRAAEPLGMAGPAATRGSRGGSPGDAGGRGTRRCVDYIVGWIESSRPTDSSLGGSRRLDPPYDDVSPHDPTVMQLEIKIFCFFASYLAALGLELWYHFRPQPILRRLGQFFGAAGLFAQTYFLVAKGAPLASQYGWMLFLAWILAVFYLFGSFHYQRLAWGVFVLPVVLGLVALGGLGAIIDPQSKERRPNQYFFIEDVLSFQAAHATLLLLATVGLCVGFIASLMYLYQSHRLKLKQLPLKGPRTLSLERLEMMNRRAVVIAFPLLTVGMMIGVVLMFVEQIKGWTDPRVLSAFVLWLAFAVLLYLRFGVHLRGRQMALWTIVTFGLLLCCLSLSHPVGQGGGR